MKDLKQLIVDYLNEQKLMQLATDTDGKPWACSVWFGFDEDLNIYFFSSTARRHSKEIENNGNVAGAVVLPHEPSDPPRGLQFEGVAEKLTDPDDLAKARSVYEGRIFDAEQVDEFMANQENPHMFYRIRPSKFVLFDVVNFPDDPRQEFEVT
ncbi:MAG: pyridoxamine 5'-phosphate oxidase family protein [bacterium]|nr:pyridoxamine 5'-phosphate oxidase family protein [bacterium]MDZ4247697.1 pyridoxamine 5'-phosphate oxidase family protein [Patescibacteria group bacterium]